MIYQYHISDISAYIYIYGFTIFFWPAEAQPPASGDTVDPVKVICHLVWSVMLAGPKKMAALGLVCNGCIADLNDTIGIQLD